MRLPRGIRRKPPRPGYYGTYRGPDGKRHEVALGANLKAAKERLNKLRYDADRIRSGLGDDVSQEYPLSRLIPEYIEHVRTRGKPGSRHYAEVRRSLEGFVAEFPGLSMVRHVTSGRVVEYQTALLRKGLAPGTINNRCEQVVSCVQWAEKVGRVARCTARHVRRLSQKGTGRRRERRVISSDELARLIAAAESIDGRYKTQPRSPLIRVVAGTGLRIGEALALRWCDVIATEAGESVRVTSQTSKTAKTRDVPLSRGVSERLKALRLESGLYLGRLPADADSIFLSQRGTPLGYMCAGRWFGIVMGIAGVEPVTPSGVCDWHALRHTWVTDMLRSGADISTVSSLAGHASIKMTMSVYAHMELVDSRPAVEAMQRMRSEDAGRSADRARTRGGERS